MMQALSTTGIEGYRPTLRLAAEERLTRMLEECLPKRGRKRARDLASILFMAFDGYIVNFHLKEHATCSVKRLKLLADILLSYEGGSTKAAGRRRNVHQALGAVPLPFKSRARFSPVRHAR
jgi:hypothetical protein